MTQDEIIQLAMEYGFTGGFDAQGNLTFDATFVEAVTEAAAKEREACAKLCDWMQEKAEFHGTDCCKFPTPTDCAYAIRARGES